jgi:hypothetical protein
MTPRRAAHRFLTPTFAVLLLWWSAASGVEAAGPQTAMPEPVDWQSSAVDLSFLNAAERPAGRRGFVRAEGDSLRFADGTAARFWGTNLTADALFGSDREAVRRQARRLSQLGFNLVRLHHHDSYWVRPNVFGSTGQGGVPDPRMLEQIDWWIACLKAEGIYVWLDLHVQRQLDARDGVAGFDEIAKGAPAVELKGYNYVNDDIRRAMQRFNEAYLGHVNVHTRLAYKDDPAVAAVLVTNENDVTHHFARALLPDKNVPRHAAAFADAARAFAERHGLPVDETSQAWRAGPAGLFLNDLEHRFHQEMVRHLRRIGVKVPIAVTSLWGGRLVSLPALTAGDLIDVHAYERPGMLQRDPRRNGGIVHTIAAAHLAGRPLSVTEWNTGNFPAADRHALPLVMAASARHQGWDAVMQYAYAQTPLQAPGKPSNWHAFNDPSLLAALPAAALLFRQGHVREAASTFVYAPTKSSVFLSHEGVSSQAGVRTAAEIGRLVTVLPAAAELPWLVAGAASGPATALADPGRPLIDEGAHAIVSATGELRRDWELGVFTVDSPRSQAAAGRLGTAPVSLGNVSIRMQGDASVAVQSLDGADIERSRDILVSVAAPSAPVAERELPFASVPLAGTISVRARAGLRLYGATLVDRSMRRVPGLEYRSGQYTIRIDGRTPLRAFRLRVPE